MPNENIHDVRSVIALKFTIYIISLTHKRRYTYTIITTSSNKQLNFLHDRMPVILDNGSKELETWLDPGQSTWSKELQCLLKPFEGDLDIYAVSQEVGKVGNNSPSFIIPVASSENKSNIANFFAKGAGKGDTKSNCLLDTTGLPGANSKRKMEGMKETQMEREPGEDRETVDHNGTEDNAPLPVPKGSNQGIKRELEDVDVASIIEEAPPSKVMKTQASPNKATALAKPAERTKSATSNAKSSPKKAVVKEKGSQKITSFFGK